MLTWLRCRQCQPRALYSTKSWSNSLLLPKTKFPLWPKPEASEEPFRAKTTDELYLSQSKKLERPAFVLQDGPPYANGDLHMGHALNKIIKDIITRFQLSMGHRVVYRPGWDCHGLPIENKALKDLKKDSHDLSPSVIRAAAQVTAKREIANQRGQFKEFGILAEWSDEGTYRTMDHDYEIRQLKVFQQMVDRGLIYRKYRPVHYSPSSRSALAEAELVYKDDHVSHTVYVSFAIGEHGLSEKMHLLQTSYPNLGLLVWTTTPWTLTANMFIAINRDFRYVVVRAKDSDQHWIIEENRLEPLQELLGPLITLESFEGSLLENIPYIPLFGSAETKRVVHASHVTSDSGTGLVHSAPAHGAEDYHAYTGQEDIICHVNHLGAFSNDVAQVVGVAADRLVGKPVLGEGSKAVVEILRELGNGRLVHVQCIKHRYPYDWKTDKPIIVTATSQWFADLSDIKPQALRALESVTFVPPQSRNRLEAFVQSRSEWCISRQRCWGIPIPALHRVSTGEAILNKSTLDRILRILAEKGVAYWWEGPVEEFLPEDLLPYASDIEKGTDTMDVWFDSGTTWTWLAENPVHGESKPYYADVVVEGTDQHRGWFQSQLLTAVGSSAANKSPYGTVITHGMVLDSEGKKMSKSLGNIISPMTVIKGGKNLKADPPMGADTLRLWAATIECWRDASIGKTALSQTRETMKRIRNSARFILGNIGTTDRWETLEIGQKERLHLVDCSVLNDLYKVEQTALEGYKSYNYPKVINALTVYLNGLSSVYFDIHKDCLYANAVDDTRRQQVVSVLKQILYTTTSIAAPVLPHLAEEIHSLVTGSSQSFFEEPWKILDGSWLDPQSELEMEQLMSIRQAALSVLETARSDRRIGSSLEARIDLVLPNNCPSNAFTDLLQREEAFLKTLLIVSDVRIVDEVSLSKPSAEWTYNQSVVAPGDSGLELNIRVSPAELHKCPRCWTYERKEADELCPRCTATLSSA